MKNVIFAILLLMPLVAFSNDEGGVKETNYQAAYAYTEIMSDDSSNYNNMSLSAYMNLPIYEYIGSSIGIAGTKYGKAKYDNFSVEGNAYIVSGSIFARDKNIGKIGVTVGYSETNSYNTYSDTTLDVDISSTSYRYGMYGSYYLNDFTLSASLNTIRLDNNHNIDTSHIGASYYFKENTTLSISKSDIDSDSSFGLAITHQPYFFENTTEVGISYSNSKYSDSVSFFVSYYFGTKVSLKTRDREYR